MNNRAEPSFVRDNLGADADDVYAALTTAHEGLNLAQSHRLNARLVLMMMNAIGDPALLQELFAVARQSIDQTDERQ